MGRMAGARLGEMGVVCLGGDALGYVGGGALFNYGVMSHPVPALEGYFLLLAVEWRALVGKR